MEPRVGAADSNSTNASSSVSRSLTPVPAASSSSLNTSILMGAAAASARPPKPTLKFQIQQMLINPSNVSASVQSSVISRVKSILWCTVEVESVRDIVTFLLERLAAPVTEDRDAAVGLLVELLKRELNDELELIDDEEDNEDENENDGLPIPTNTSLMDISSNSSTEIANNISAEMADEQQQSPLNRLNKISFFSSLKNDICEMLAHCCMVECDLSRLTHYLKFIAKYADSAILNRLASNLIALLKSNSALSTADEDDENGAEPADQRNRIRRCLIEFYARYIYRIERLNNTPKTSKPTREAADDENNSMLDVNESDLLSVRINNPKMKFQIDRKVLETILELLAEAFCEDSSEIIINNNAREYLAKIFYGPMNMPISEHLNVTLSADPNYLVDVFSSELRVKMLSARDERIVELALAEINAEEAVDFLQSFALPTFGYAHLLAIVNASELTRTSSSAALAAVPFVRAYQIKNVEGCDEFLAKIEPFINGDSPDNNSATHQKSLAEARLKQNRLPKLPPAMTLTEIQPENKSKNESDFSQILSASHYLNELATDVSASDSIDAQIFDNSTVSSTRFCAFLDTLEARDSETLSSTNEYLKYVKTIVELLGQKLATFAQKLPNTLSAILVAFVYISSKNKDVHNMLNNLAERAQRVCPEARFVASVLHCFCQHSAGRTGSLLPFGGITDECVASTGSDGCELDEESEESSLEQMARLISNGKLSEYNLEIMLEQYCIKNPQFFQFFAGLPSTMAKFRREVIALFGADCRLLSSLVLRITSYSDISIIRCVVNVLLDKFIDNVRPSFVMEFVGNAAMSIDAHCRCVPNVAQCATLVEYALAEVLAADANSASKIMSLKPKKGHHHSAGDADTFTSKKFAFSPYVSAVASHDTAKAETLFVADALPDVVECLMRILAAVLEPADMLTHAASEEATLVKARALVESLQAKIHAIEERFRDANEEDSMKEKTLRALKRIIRAIERRFPGFVWSRRSTLTHILPDMLRENNVAFGVSPALFIGSRVQLLRPLELLSLSDFDDILHRTLIDLNKLVTTNSAVGQAKMHSGASGQLTLAVMENLVAETRAKPFVMARQLPLLSVFVSSILQRPFRQFRDAPFLLRFLEFNLDVLIGAVPDSFNDVSAVEFLLQCYLRFFENVGSAIRKWRDVLEKTGLALLAYAEHRPREATRFVGKYAYNIRFLTKRCMDRYPTENGRLLGFCAAARVANKSSSAHGTTTTALSDDITDVAANEESELSLR